MQKGGLAMTIRPETLTRTDGGQAAAILTFLADPWTGIGDLEQRERLALDCAARGLDVTEIAESLDLGRRQTYYTLEAALAKVAAHWGLDDPIEVRHLPARLLERVLQMAGLSQET